MSVSVIIATFNRAGMIGDAIRSAMAQTYPDVEVIVVDDGSTDDTGEVVARFQGDAARPLRYLKKGNEGCASARNEGVGHARGDYLIFLDSDDRLLPGAVEALVEAVERSGADFAYSPSIEVDRHGTERLSYPVAKGRPELLAAEHFKFSRLRSGAALFKRRVFDEVGGFDEKLKYNEDSDFLQRVSICCKAAYSPSPSVRVLHHRGAKSADRVAIYSALLESSKKILALHPEFGRSLAEGADDRLAEIHFQLGKAYLGEGMIWSAIAQFRSSRKLSKEYVNLRRACAALFRAPRGALKGEGP